MKILSLTNCPLNPALGSGKSVLRHSEGLRKLGHSVDVVQPGDFELLPRLKIARQYRYALGAYKVVKQKLQTERYDIVEFYGAIYWKITEWLWEKQPRPLLVAHTNGLELLDKECQDSYDPATSLRKNLLNHIYKRLYHSFFVHTDGLVCLTDMDREYVLKLKIYLPQRIITIRPGLDEIFASIPFVKDKQDRIAYMGSFTPRKGIKNLCEVMEKVLTHNQKAYFDLYGTFRERQTILNNFSPQLHNRIVVHPILSDKELADNIARAKVFFFPSRYEGFGFALAEAMACSCAAVTTPTGFGPELRSGKEAIICGFNDTKAMEDSILNLLTNDEARSKIAYEGWKRVQSLKWEESIKRLSEIYAEWLRQDTDKLLLKS